MVLQLLDRHLPPFAWEESIVDSTGVPLPRVRFMISCFSSVALSLGWRFVPTPKGEFRIDVVVIHRRLTSTLFFSSSSSKIPHSLSSSPSLSTNNDKKKARHAYAIATGLLLLAYPFGSGIANLAVPAVATYALIAQLPAHAGTLAWCLDFSFLLWRQFSGASGGAWKEGRVDYTGALMILTLKCIAAAVSRQDGATARVGLGPYAATHATRSAPTPLEWASYCLSCGGLLSGPFFELGDYLDYVNRVGAWECESGGSGGGSGGGGGDGASDGAGARDRNQSSSSRLPYLRPALVASLLRLVKAVACAAAYFVLSPRFGPSMLESSSPSSPSSKDGSSGVFFASAPLASKFALLWAAGVTDRAKYYAVWAIAEAGLIAAGFSYTPPPPPATTATDVGGEEQKQQNGGGSAAAAAATTTRAPPTTTNDRPTTTPSPNPKSPPAPSFERFTNARILGVEGATSAAALPLNWNVCTGRFLRHYVYERLTRGGRGGLRTLLVTQGVAGLWHGTFPGYALFFLSSAFMFESSKAIYRYEKYSWPRWVAGALPWRAAKWLFVAACLNYSSSAFIILDLGPSLRVWRAVHFLPSFVMAAIVVVAKVVPPRRSRSRSSSSRTAAAGTAAAGAAGTTTAAAGASGEPSKKTE